MVCLCESSPAGLVVVLRVLCCPPLTLSLRLCHLYYSLPPPPQPGGDPAEVRPGAHVAGAGVWGQERGVSDQQGAGRSPE